MIYFAKEPPDTHHQSLREHLACLVQADGWSFNLIYVITFGGFIGLSTFLPSFFYAEFGVTKVEASYLTMLAAIMGSGIRAVGGYAADRVGGIAALCVVLMAVIGGVSRTVGDAVAGDDDRAVHPVLCRTRRRNGALFQMVPLRWPANTAVASSMIGEIGALGGAILPNAMGLSKQWTGSFAGGFLFYAALSRSCSAHCSSGSAHGLGHGSAPGGGPGACASGIRHVRRMNA